MADEAKKDKKESLKVMYVGNDNSYFGQIKTRFQTTYDEYNHDFIIKSFSNPKLIHEFYLELVEEAPNIVYFDFSQFQNEILYIAQLATQESQLKDTAIVGLLDYLAPVTLRKAVTLNGIKICHVKSGEMHDVVYDAMYVFNPDKAKDPDFCVAKLADSIRIHQVCRLHSVSEKMIGVEGDFSLAQGDEIEVKSTLYPKIVSSLKFAIKQVESVNLTYDYSSRLFAGFVYVDPISAGGGENVQSDNSGGTEMVAGAQAFEDRELKIENTIRRLNQWIKNEFDAGMGERIKLLMVDREFTILQKAPKRLDYLPHDFKVRAFLHNYDKDILVYHPHFIVFQYESETPEPPPEEAAKKAGPKPPMPPPPGKKPEEKKEDVSAVDDNYVKNGETSLRTVMATIQKLQGYTPFVIVFNCRISSEALQKEFNYPQIMVYPHPLDYDMVINMANIFKKKLEKKAEAEKTPRTALSRGKSKKNENQVVVFKANDLNRTSAKMIYPVKLISASESLVNIESQKPIPLWTVHKIEIDQLQMYVTLVPEKEKEKGDSAAPKAKKGGSSGHAYRGLIHAIGENDKKALRRFVNSIFFRKLEEEKQKDLAQFKELNEQKSKAASDAAEGGEGSEGGGGENAA